MLFDTLLGASIVIVAAVALALFCYAVILTILLGAPLLAVAACAMLLLTAGLVAVEVRRPAVAS